MHLLPELTDGGSCGSSRSYGKGGSDERGGVRGARADGGSCGSGGNSGSSGIAPDSLTRQLPTTPKGTSWKKMTEGAAGAVGCEPHGQMVKAMGDSPRLTYSAIADNPEGGQAGKR